MTKQYRCPACGSTQLWVDITATAELDQDEDDNIQTFVDGDHYWDDDSLMGCHKCGNTERARKFNTQRLETT